MQSGITPLIFGVEEVETVSGVDNKLLGASPLGETGGEPPSGWGRPPEPSESGSEGGGKDDWYPEEEENDDVDPKSDWSHADKLKSLRGKKITVIRKGKTEGLKKKNLQRKSGL